MKNLFKLVSIASISNILILVSAMGVFIPTAFALSLTQNWVAYLRQGSMDGTISSASLNVVTFDGKEEATILADASILSDPVDLSLSPLTQLAVSVYLPYSTPMTAFQWHGCQCFSTAGT